MRPVALGSVALAISAAAIAMGSTAASAATTSGGPSPVQAAANAAPQAINLAYTCAPPSSGSASTTTPTDVTVTISAPSSVAAGSTAGIALSTTALSTSVISSADLAQATGVSFSAEAPVTYAGATPTVKLNSSATISSTSTQIPATGPTATNLPLPTAGTAKIGAPATVTIIATGAKGANFTAVTCTAPTATQSISIAVTSASTVPTPSFPSYTCKVYVNGKYQGTLPPMPLAESVRVSGKLTTGSTDTVTWVSPPAVASPTPANPGGLGGPYTDPNFTITRVTFQGSLPVTGAQQGSISLYRSTADTAITVLKVTGSLFLSQPGTIYIHLPQAFKFTAIFKAPNGASAASTLACSTKTSQVAATLKVTGNPVQPPTAQGSGTPVATGTPVGAPATGGGRPASNLPLVAGGAALLAVGAGLAFTARRRRHSEN